MWYAISDSFFSVLIGFLICLAINHYHEVNNPTGFEQMLIDGDAEYLVVFGDEYVGDALNVYTEGEAYIIMDGDKKIGKVTTVVRKFGVVLRFYWNLSST